MRRLVLVVLVCLPPGTGCAALAVKRSTVQQIGSVSDLRYQQLVDNLAVVAANPGTLPSLSIVADGTALVTDTVIFDAKTMWTRAMFNGFSSEALTPGFTRNPQPIWTLDPMADVLKLDAAWYALRWALGCPPELGSPGDKVLKQFQIEKGLRNLPPDWLHVGCHADVPLRAAYKSHSGNTWVWVNPEDMAGLSALTLVVLDIGTSDVNSLQEVLAGNPTTKVKVEISGSTDKKATGPDKQQTIEQDKQLAVQNKDTKIVQVNLCGFPTATLPKLPDPNNKDKLILVKVFSFNPLDLSALKPLIPPDKNSKGPMTEVLEPSPIPSPRQSVPFNGINK